MQTRNGKRIAYGMTTDGVMVQVHRGTPPANEWSEMVEAIRQNRDVLIGIVVLAPTSEGPSATQRKQVAAVAATFPESFRGVAVLTHSILVRGALTAINWLIPGGVDSRAFTLDDLEGAFRYLRLDEGQRARAKSVIAELDGPQRRDV